MFSSTGLVLDYNVIIRSKGSIVKISAFSAKDTIMSPMQRKIPFIIVTRGTDTSEKEVAKVSRLLGFHVSSYSHCGPTISFQGLCLQT